VFSGGSAKENVSKGSQKNDLKFLPFDTFLRTKKLRTNGRGESNGLCGYEKRASFAECPLNIITKRLIDPSKPLGEAGLKRRS
jgi:hypothetical protein